MLNIDELRRVKTIVTHEGCADGIASALILRDALPEAEVVFVQYGTPAHRELRASPGMLFCDMTPHPGVDADDLLAFVDAGAIVLDHHRSQRWIVEAFGDRGVYADEQQETGVSGAVLAFEHVWVAVGGHELKTRPSGWVEKFAVLAGIRDTWQRSSPLWREACAQAATLRFWPTETLLAGGLYRLRERLDIGETLLQRGEERDTKTLEEAHRFSVDTGSGERLHVVAFEGLHTSDIADRLASVARLILGWHYLHEPGKGARLVVSCRSRGGFSALAFAKAHGGGGHEHAAGFAIDAPDDAPHVLLPAMVRAFVSAHGNGV